MNNTKQKYRLAVIFLSLFYINFFVFIPYFHHHHSSNTKFDNNGKIVLAFSPSDCCETVCKSNCDNYHNIDAEHSHQHEVCSKNDITSSWDNQLNFKVNKSAQIDYRLFIDDQISSTQLFVQSIHLINWQKIVHRAANLSPPIS